MNCKYCGSPNIVRFGTLQGIQRYWCKDCERKFADNQALPTMKTPMKHISSALSCYYGGMSLDAIQRHLQQQFGKYYSEMGIYNWVIRFSQEAIDRVKGFQPIVGDTWIADETVLKVGGRNIWFFDVIDEKTRYLLASRLATSRTIKEAALVMNEAKRRAGKAPQRIITDKLAAYIDGIELVFGADTEHIQSKPFTDVNSTNVIERFHGTLKDRTKVVRGFKNMESARLLTEAWLVHYNFFKEHGTLGDVPPAVKMGATPIKDWAEVVSQTKTITPLRPKAVLPIGLKPARKPRHPKRRPKTLKQKAYAQVTVTSPKAAYADKSEERLSRKPHRGWKRIY
ncbi:MAG: DDE-type integrase/transposase/recombinase [Dehalococcoidia bacterium]